MNSTANHIDELIGKFLAGEASAEEAAQVESWAGEHEANRKYVEHFRIIFDRASSVKALHQFDEDAAWMKLKAKLKPEAKVVPFHKEKTDLKFFFRIAATIVIVLGVGLFVYKLIDPSVKEMELVAETKTVNEKLPDGSGVVLNKETKLSYAFDKRKKSHVVKLKGEAYFKINHEEKKDFVIDIDGVYIRDIGTSFNVKAYPKSNTIEVVVEDGEVLFFTERDSGVLLHASGKGVYDKVTKTFSIEKPESNVLSYKTKSFSFNNTVLGSVVEDLNSVYDKKIVLGKNLKQCRLTVMFNNEDIDEIASVIAETLNLTVKESSTEIILEGKGCE